MRAEELLRVEAQARAGGKGLWGERAYQVMSPREAVEAASDLVEPCQRGTAPLAFVVGVIESVQESEGRASLAFSASGDDAPFALVVFGRAHRDWRGPAFQTYEGQRVRARGFLENFRPRSGPADAPGRAQMCVDDAGAIEIIERE